MQTRIIYYTITAVYLTKRTSSFDKLVYLGVRYTICTGLGRSIGEMLKILIVDDHELFGDGLATILAQLDVANSINVTLEIIRAATADEAIDIVNDTLKQGHKLDLALLDLTLPDGHGMDVLEVLREKMSKCPVVVISATEERHEIIRALDAGASGFIPKSLPTNVIIPALQLVLSGHQYLPPQLLSQRPLVHALTDRQIQVLRYIHDGLSNKVIAREMGLSESTIKAHIRQIFSTLEAKSRSHAVNIAVQSGIL